MPTDQERMAAFQECTKKETDQSTAIGLGFIVDVLQGDIPSAAVDWAQMALTAANNGNNCMQLLTPEQQAAVRAELIQQHNDYIQNQENLKGPAFGSNL
jgi:hypothetical protein